MKITRDENGGRGLARKGRWSGGIAGLIRKMDHFKAYRELIIR